MRLVYALAAVLATAAPVARVEAQKNQEKEEEFVKTRPLVGDRLPNVTVYTADGRPFQTSDLRGHYTVLTFGCLT